MNQIDQNSEDEPNQTNQIDNDHLVKLKLLEIFSEISKLQNTNNAPNKEAMEKVDSIWESKFANEKGSVMLNQIKEWIEEEGGLLVSPSDHWLLQQCFCCQGNDIAEWIVTKE